MRTEAELGEAVASQETLVATNQELGRVKEGVSPQILGGTWSCQHLDFGVPQLGTTSHNFTQFPHNLVWILDSTIVR